MMKYIRDILRIQQVNEIHSENIIGSNFLECRASEYIDNNYLFILAKTELKEDIEYNIQWIKKYENTHNVNSVKKQLEEFKKNYDLIKNL